MKNEGRMIRCVIACQCQCQRGQASYVLDTYNKFDNALLESDAGNRIRFAASIFVFVRYRLTYTNQPRY